ncbi:CBN-ACL-14 protein [Aphelenchoides besseyi]|nr:CBN-ACL-14 protein [Aphelenchoides besseyi]
MADETVAAELRQRYVVEDETEEEQNANGINAKKKTEKPPGSRSRWSQASYFERVIWVLGVPLRAVLCVSNVTVFFVTYFGFMVTVLWARWFWPRFYWFYEGKLYMWLQGFIGYWGYTADYDVYEYGDDITSYGDSDRVLVMINHQSTADVPTLFTVFQHKGVATRKTLWLMDVMFRWTPFGIIGRMHGDYFIQQGKASRDRELVRLRQHLEKVFWDRDRRWVIIFPEGGFYYKRVESSQKYARENGFPHLKHTTLPRMGAVKVILDTLGPRKEDADSRESSSTSLHQSRSGNHIKLLKDTVGAIREKKYVKGSFIVDCQTRPPIKYVLDVTIAYPNAHPLSLGTLIFGNRENCDIAVNYKMYRASEVPFHDETKLRDWMYKVYQEKDELLERYYKWGTFNEGERGHRIVFPWSRIIGQYAFWFGSFFLQMKFYSFLLSKLYYFFFPPLH